MHHSFASLVTTRTSSKACFKKRRALRCPAQLPYSIYFKAKRGHIVDEGNAGVKRRTLSISTVLAFLRVSRSTNEKLV